MSTNTEIKRRMIKRYGNKCFIEALGFRSEEEVKRELRLYGSKKQRFIAQQLTYHHILEKRNGGKATMENGALLKEINHQWFNKQKPEYQAEMNKAFQEYKQVFDLVIAHTTTDGIQQAKKIRIEEPEEYLTFKAYDNKDFQDKDYREHKKQRNERVFKKFEGVER